jgi:hypothetical protein
MLPRCQDRSEKGVREQVRDSERKGDGVSLQKITEYGLDPNRCEGGYHNLLGERSEVDRARNTEALVFRTVANNGSNLLLML